MRKFKFNVVKSETVAEFLARGGKVKKVDAQSHGAKKQRNLTPEEVKALPKGLAVKFNLR